LSFLACLEDDIDDDEEKKRNDETERQAKIKSKLNIPCEPMSAFPMNLFSPVHRRRRRPQVICSNLYKIGEGDGQKQKATKISAAFGSEGDRVME